MTSKSIRIEYDQTKCIGAQSCVKANPQVFGFDNQSQKAILVDGKNNGEISILSLTGEETIIQKAILAAAACPVNAFKVIDLSTQTEAVTNDVKHEHVESIRAEYDDSTHFVLDPAGYFLIRLVPGKKEIEVGFCSSKNVVIFKVIGKNPLEIYHTVSQKLPVELRKEHYAYLGRELQKAYHCLQTGLNYVQDDELHEMKPAE